MEKHQLKKAGLAAIAAAVLAGCAGSSDEAARQRIASLEAEVVTLQDKLDTQSVETDRKIAYWEKQASVAAGCDVLLPLCPASITEAGHAAQLAGYGGGTSWPFWLALFGKLAAVGALLGALVSAVRVLWLVWGRPTAKASKQAGQLIAGVQAQTQKAEERMREAQALESQAHDRTRDLQARAMKIQAQTTEMSAQLEHVRAELVKTTQETAAIRAAREALDTVDG